MQSSAASPAAKNTAVGDLTQDSSSPPAKNTKRGGLTREARDLEVLKRADQRNRRKWQRVLGSMARASELNDDGSTVAALEVPPGWTPQEYRIALDARRNGREAPKYLDAAIKVATEAQRLDSLGPQVPELAVDVKIYVRQDVVNYPVVDLDPTARKR